MSKTRQDPSIFDFETADQWIKAVYSARKNRNTSYSLRAFSKSLGLTHPVLSRLLQGKTKLSPETVRLISEKLNLTSPETKYFEQIASGNPERAVLDQLKTQATAHRVEFGDVSEILSLKTIALLQLVEKKNYLPFDVAIAAKRLSITVEETKGLLKKLKFHGMITLEKDGQPHGTGKRILLETVEAKKSLTDLYKSGLRLAEMSLDQHLPAERVIGSEFLSFDHSDLGEASQLIDECLNRLVALSKRSKNPGEVYYCNTVLFRLTEKGVQSA